MSQKIQSAVLVLVLSALFVSSAYALPPVPVASGPRTGGFLAATWSWLASFVSQAAPVHTPGLKAIWGNADSSMAPKGQTNNFSSNATPDEGVKMDPNG
jgi:hypothetical protein